LISAHDETEIGISNVGERSERVGGKAAGQGLALPHGTGTRARTGRDAAG
jgi:mannitol/fructose-specific phosphotransferase system IIA component